MVDNKGYIGKVMISENGSIRIRYYKDRMGVKKKSICNKNDIKEYKKNEDENKMISQRSRKRTRQNLYEIINNNINDFNSLITLTFKEEIDDYNLAYGYIKNYIRNIRRNIEEEELKYVIIPEIQEERSKKVGKDIIHFHMLTNIKVGSKLIPKRENIKNKSYIKGKWYVLKYYDLLYWNYGFSSAMEIDNNVIGLTNYLYKYLSKNNSFLFGRRKLITSQNLKRDIIYKINDEDELQQMLDDYKPYLKNVYTHFPSKRFMPTYTEYEYQF